MPERFPQVVRTLCVAGALLFGFLHACTTRLFQPSFVEPDGYEAIVNRAIGTKLELRAASGESSELPGAAPGDGAGSEAASDPTPAADEDVRIVRRDTWDPAVDGLFESQSFLGEDVLDPSLWRQVEWLTGGSGPPTTRLKLQAGLRRRPLPFAARQLWRGGLAFRQGAEVLSLRDVETATELRFTRRSEGVTRTVNMAARGDQSAVSNAERYVWIVPEGRQQIMELRVIDTAQGRRVMLRADPVAGTTVTLGGRVLRSTTALYRILAPGDALTIAARADFEGAPIYTRSYQLVRRPTDLISELRRSEEGESRVFLDAHGLEPLARTAGSVLDGAVSFRFEQLSRSGRDPDTDAELARLQARDVALTIDLGLQQSAQAMLEAGVEKRVTQKGGARQWWVESRSSPERRAGSPPRGALSIVDIGSGELLAAASYPRATHLQRHIDAIRGAATLRGSLSVEAARQAERFLDRRADTITRNHVFTHHQIGSVVKPLFAASMALAWKPGVGGPDPLELTVPMTRHTQLVGDDYEITLEPGPGQREPNRRVELRPERFKFLIEDNHACTSARTRGVVDFDCFIGSSCHWFMFELGRRALSDPAYRRRRKPDDPRYRDWGPTSCADGENVGSFLHGQKATSAPLTASDAADFSWLAYYLWLTRAPADLNEPAPGSLFDETWWGPLADDVNAVGQACDAGEPPQYRSLRRVSPEIIDLGINGSVPRSFQTCRVHYSNFLKGGGTNRMSNADVSIAYARLLSGVPLTGRLVIGDDDALASRPSARTPDERSAAPPTAAGATPTARHDASENDAPCLTSLACGDPARYRMVRDRVLSAMHLAVVEGTVAQSAPRGGPAARSRGRPLTRLRAELERQTGRRWLAYAKTGSSLAAHTTIEGEEVSPIDGLALPKLGSTKIAIGNFTLALLQCDAALPRESESTEERVDDACTLPAPGRPLTGFLVHVWLDGVPGITGGAGTLALFEPDLSAALEERLAAFASEMRR
jgi:hypothetical protein